MLPELWFWVRFLLCTFFYQDLGLFFGLKSVYKRTFEGVEHGYQLRLLRFPRVVELQLLAVRGLSEQQSSFSCSSTGKSLADFGILPSFLADTKIGPMSLNAGNVFICWQEKGKCQVSTPGLD